LLRYARTATATATATATETARLMSCLVEAHASLKVERLTGGDGWMGGWREFTELN